MDDLVRQRVVHLLLRHVLFPYIKIFLYIKGHQLTIHHSFFQYSTFRSPEIESFYRDLLSFFFFVHIVVLHLSRISLLSLHPVGVKVLGVRHTEIRDSELESQSKA